MRVSVPVSLEEWQAAEAKRQAERRRRVEEAEERERLDRPDGHAWDLSDNTCLQCGCGRSAETENSRCRKSYHVAKRR